MKSIPLVSAAENNNSAIVLDNKAEDCKQILLSYNLDYAEIDHYLQVGEIPLNEEWILHISVIRLHFTPLLKKILPLLLAERITFRIPRDKETAKDMLDGMLGFSKIGKIICIYPKQNTLVELAKQLVALTIEFKGPAISGNSPLGGCIYAEYKNATSLRKDITWPFDGIAKFHESSSKALWNYKYKPLHVIKQDVKGRVIQGNYFKSALKIKSCIIKEGIKNMWADEFGRDIVDRLKWQYELHEDLQGKLSIPAIYDFFEEHGNSYLVLQFIKGERLVDKIQDIYNENSWHEISVSQKQVLTDYLLKVLILVEKLHDKGYVHRDLTPHNFIIANNDQVVLIDMELTYSLNKRKPDPPFKLGSLGYMSPEQKQRDEPTFMEDVYAIGALMLFVYTGLPPVKFDVLKVKDFKENIRYFINNPIISELIINCMSQEPESRPTIAAIIKSVSNFRSTLMESCLAEKIILRKESTSKEVIDSAIEGICSPLTVSTAGLWLSNLEPEGVKGLPSQIQSTLPGFGKGIAGYLFLMAKAHKYGYKTLHSTELFRNNWEYLRNHYLGTNSNLDLGFFSGYAGIALAINEAIESRLLGKDTRVFLELCFPVVQSQKYDLANGIAGTGLSLLRCKHNLSSDFLWPRLFEISESLLSAQKRNGSWLNYAFGGKPNDNILGLGFGTAGVLCFLLAYIQQRKDERVIKAIRRGLNWLISEGKGRSANYHWPVSTKSNSVNRMNATIGTPGIILTFIKAYELFQDPAYKEIAENALYSLPQRPVSDDFTQFSGLAGLGEVYLEAFSAFKSIEWHIRANWIADIFQHTQLTQDDNTRYWSMNQMEEFEGDILTGALGIVHYLIRVRNPDKIGHLLIDNNF